MKVNSTKEQRVEGLKRRVYEAALSAWADWLHTFAVGGRSTHTASAILRQANAMDVRSTTPGVYSNPTLSFVLAEEKAWWSAAASIDAIICGLPRDERVAVLGEALGYSQATVAEAIGCARRTVSDIQARARAKVVPRLMLTANVVRLMARMHGMELAPPARSGIVGACAV